MDIAKPNEHGILQGGRHEIVARLRRAYAAVNIALCDDGLYRFSTELHYSYGGFCGPIRANEPGHPSLDAALNAGLEELLRKWRRPFPSDPASVHEELQSLREQLEAKLRQPTLF
jgi:hypothetical protein